MEFNVFSPRLNINVMGSSGRNDLLPCFVQCFKLPNSRITILASPSKPSCPCTSPLRKPSGLGIAEDAPSRCLPTPNPPRNRLSTRSEAAHNFWVWRAAPFPTLSSNCLHHQHELFASWTTQLESHPRPNYHPLTSKLACERCQLKEPEYFLGILTSSK